MASADRTVLTESDITTPGPLKTALDSAGGDAPVSSVNGSTGDVVLSAPDVGAMSSSVTYLSETDDLNDFIETGYAHRPASAGTLAANNFPEDGFTGTIQIIKAGSNQVTQIAYTRQTTPGESAAHLSRVWFRSHYGGSWGGWVRLDPGAVTPENIGAPDVEQVSGTVDMGGDSISFGPGHALSNGAAVGAAFTTAEIAYDTAMAGAPKGKVDGLLVRSGIQTLTNPTTIPTDGPERLDLVFTEPTTVAFATPHYDADPDTSSPQAPGVTDLVLSIEGYEHVTWDGVVIHGTPDQSGVVWASALWRQRDSTWHLLCEQDSSSGGGANLRTFTWDNKTYSPVEGSDGPGTFNLDSHGRVIHETTAHPYYPEGRDELVTLSIKGGADEILVSGNYVPTSRVNFSALNQCSIQQSVATPTNGLSDGFILYISSYEMKAEGIHLEGMFVYTQTPFAGLTNPPSSTSSGTTYTIPKEVLPPIGYFDTGNPTNSASNPGKFTLKGGIQMELRVSNLESYDGIALRLSGPSEAIPAPDPNDPSLTPIEKAYAETYGFHTLALDVTLPYDYWSMTTPKP